MTNVCSQQPLLQEHIFSIHSELLNWPLGTKITLKSHLLLWVMAELIYISMAEVFWFEIQDLILVTLSLVLLLKRMSFGHFTSECL